MQMPPQGRYGPCLCGQLGSGLPRRCPSPCLCQEPGCWCLVLSDSQLWSLIRSLGMAWARSLGVEVGGGVSRVLVYCSLGCSKRG